MSTDRDWTDQELANIYAALAEIPDPADALDLQDWDYDENPPADTYSRWFHIRKWVDGTASEVALCVAQIAVIDTTGDHPRVTGWHLGNQSIYATVSDDLTAAAARRFAAALNEAANLMDPPPAPRRKPARSAKVDGVRAWWQAEQARLASDQSPAGEGDPS